MTPEKQFRKETGNIKPKVSGNIEQYEDDIQEYYGKYLKWHESRDVQIRLLVQEYEKVDGGSTEYYRIEYNLLSKCIELFGGDV